MMKKIKYILATALGWAVFFISSARAEGGWDISSVSGFGLPEGSISGIIENLLMWILGIFGFLGVLGFVISGVMYLIAAGDEDMMKRAKNTMYWSITGVIVGLVGVVVIQAISLALDEASIF